MITIISQPPVKRLMSAYRPIISIVEFTDNIVPIYFNVTVTGGVATFVAEDEAPFVPGPLTVTFGNAPGLNGTYTAFVWGISNPGHIVTFQATVALTDGSYPQTSITLNGVPVLNTNISGAPKAAYCDIYIQGIYYKTVSKTQPLSTGSNTSRFEFDIQNALQEYLTKYLPSNGGIAIETDILNQVYCKFRSSTFDNNGFLVPDGPVPVQATGTTPPTGGGGTKGNEFFGVNAVLQHTDNQDLQTHLNAFKLRTWDANMYPLTHRPDNYKLCKGDNDWFPAINVGKTLRCIKITYFDKAGNMATDSYCPEFPIVLYDLIFKWNRAAGDSISLVGVINGDFGTVNWGDGTVNNLLTHSYATTGNFTVTVQTNSTILYFIDNLDFLGTFSLTEIVQFIPSITKVTINPQLGSTGQISTFPSTVIMANLEEFKCNSKELTAIPDFSSNVHLKFLVIGFSTVITGAIDISMNHHLEQIVLNLPLITAITADYNVCSYFESVGCRLTIAAVNAILVGLDANGIVEVFSQPVPKCYLYNQTPAAAPTGAGAAAKANLISPKGWNPVQTD